MTKVRHFIFKRKEIYNSFNYHLSCNNYSRLHLLHYDDDNNDNDDGWLLNLQR